MRSMSTCCGPAADSRAGAAAAAPCPAACPGSTAGFAGAGPSGSRISAPSPRPSAFLGISDNLLGELRVALRALAVKIVENDWFSETWCFREAHVARNQALEDLRAEKTTQIGGNLARKRSPLIKHG